MSDRVYNALFLCTGNAARSILAEAILNRVGQGRFKAFSAGSRPAGAVHPCALDLLGNLNYGTGWARSKSWDEFAGPDPRRAWISSSRSATTPPPPSAPSGPASP